MNVTNRAMPSSSPDDRILWLAVQQKLQSLSAQEIAVFLLSFIGYQQKEIALLVGVSRTTVKKSFERAVQSLALAIPMEE